MVRSETVDHRTVNPSGGSVGFRINGSRLPASSQVVQLWGRLSSNQGVLEAMFRRKPQLRMAVLVTTLAWTVANALLCSSVQAVEAQPAPRKKALGNDGGKKTIEAKSMESKIEMKVSEPRFRKPEPELPDFTYWEVKVKYKNDSKEEIVLSPFVNIEVYDAANKPVENDVFIGAGFIGEDWMPSNEKEFLVIPPGKSREIRVNLGDNRSPGETIGWEFQQPGTYRIVVKYHHSRKAFAAKYFTDRFFFTNDALQRAKLPERMWNRAVEMERAVEVKLTIKP
jgi:hypothetical protein